MGWVFQFSLWIEYCCLLPCLPQGVLTRGCHGSLSWVSTSLVWSSGCFWLLGAGSRPVVPLCSLASSHCSVVCDASWGPPLFPRSLRRSLASCLAALPFASLPLVSRPWTVLSWSHLMSLCSVSNRFVVVPRQLAGLGGCSPLRPIALLLALGSSGPSGSLLRYRFESSR